MLLHIHTSDGTTRATVCPTDSSTHTHEIQGDNTLSLQFTLTQHIAFDVNDYVDYLGTRFHLLEHYVPTQRSTIEWDYQLRLFAGESLLRRILVLLNTDGQVEPVFTLTAQPREHVQLIADSINAALGTPQLWQVGDVEGDQLITIDYQGLYCHDALLQLAQQLGTEFWTTATTICISHCQHGQPITLGYRQGLTSIEPAQADGQKFFTRLFPIGSQRNIDPSTYGHSRLQLPDGAHYIDHATQQYGIIHHADEAAFAHIYPRRTGTITSVRSEPAINTDGTPYRIYYFQDSGLSFSPAEHQIPGQAIHISFQSGHLLGLGSETQGGAYFEANFSPLTGEFELITQWPYHNDTPLPSTTLCPAVGDTYIMWNIRMPQAYVTAAEQELLQAAQAYIQQQSRDTTVYRCHTDHIYLHRHGITLTPGQRVTLLSTHYFPTTGERTSRITRVARRINLPHWADIEISDVLSVGQLQAIAAQVEQTRQVAANIATQATPHILRTGDDTTPTDFNLLSALRTLSEIATRSLSRQHQDTALAHIAFQQGLSASQLASLRQGAHFGEFVSGLYTGHGAAIDPQGNAEVETLRVRSFLEAAELVINRISAIEGDQLLTEADTIERIISRPEPDTFGLYLHPKWEGYVTAQQAGSVIKGIVNTLQQGTAGQYHTSWMRINSVNPAANYIEVTLYPHAQVPGGTNHPPIAMMRIARWGHQSRPELQQCLYLSSHEGRIVKLTGVTQPIISHLNYGATFGLPPEFLASMQLPIEQGRDYLYAMGIITQDIIRIDYQGQPIPDIVDRGTWQSGLTYYAAEQNTTTHRYETSDVWHLGCRWRCTHTHTATPQLAPRWNNTHWAQIEGNPAFELQILPTDTIFSPDRFYVTLQLQATLHHQDVTADILPQDIQWTRTSTDAQGNPRTQSDHIWNLAHAASAHTLSLTPADANFDSQGVSSLTFRADVTLRDQAASAEFSY